MSDQGFIKETKVLFELVLGGRQPPEILYVSSCQLTKRTIAAVRIPQLKLVLGMSGEECFCEENI
jgi:hypothetical protein